MSPLHKLWSVPYRSVQDRHGVVQQSSRTSSSCLTVTYVCWKAISCLLSPRPLATSSLLSASLYLTFPDTSYPWDHECRSFCDWLTSHLACLQGSPMGSLRQDFHLLLRRNNIPSEAYTTFLYPFIHWCTFSLFSWLLGIVLPWTWKSKHFF